ncbi:GTP-binding protein [Phytohabitans suffuscus]|uniref:CobW/HypB/UreG nucleotide-binding domain-containing protein n=1 Tax=Phytohabitans suffuscus TaxID=624315 RepID=A0A6F8YAZ8_9ACTN|nr:GTP-binding protein [Phytohabitans suffuscus]BCB83158.1 hypothetical protein Psuf_004710 [Phytohabitans suffuscus]
MSVNPAAAPADTRPAVTVLAGFSPAAPQAVATVLSVAGERLLVVRHDISEVRSGIVRRTVRTADEVVEDTAANLAHGCVSCTLREDVPPTLARLARQRPTSDIVLVLPPVVEPDAVATDLAARLRRTGHSRPRAGAGTMTTGRQGILDRVRRNETRERRR